MIWHGALSRKAPKRRTRIVRLALRLLLALLTLVSILTSVFGLLRWSLHRDNERRLEAIKATGQPTQSAELIPWLPVVPTNENAAVLYAQGGSLYVHPRKIGARFHPWYPPYPLDKSPLSNAVRTVFEDFVATNQRALLLFHEAARRGGCSFALDLSTLVSHPPSYLPALRLFGGALEVEAVIHAELGHADEASRSLEAHLALARFLEREPLLESVSTRRSLVVGSALVIQRMLNRLRMSEPQLKDLELRLGKITATNLLPRAFLAQRAIYLPVFDLSYEQATKLFAPRHGDLQFTEDENEAAPMRVEKVVEFFAAAIGAKEMDKRLFLRLADTNLAAAKLPFPPALELAQLAQEELANTFPISKSIAYESFHSVGSDFEEEAAMQALLRCVLSALAVERWRLAHSGHVPQSLLTLVPDLISTTPVDPFDGQPLRFQTNTSGYCIYSIGQNRRDDRGQKRLLDRWRKDLNCDITFVVTY